ncbi:MAG: aldehyde ferredoxin oxidoreductase [Proteobacteria bacterium]|nr:aldehyde ferredoxin oxidoreductase [Pseudomonadota bacterium]
MARLLRVNMSEIITKFEPVPEAYLGLGGRGLTSAIISKEVDPTCSAIGPVNKLVVATGLLGGTKCANSGRLSVGAKSPLTGGIKEANSGGQPGIHLGRLDIMAIVVEGHPQAGKFYKLVINAQGAELVPADELKGLGNYDTVEKLKAVHGDKVSYITIGQAGEAMLTSASVACTDTGLRPTRHAGRGGLGAVMGSKGLKAIVIDPSGGHMPEMADPEAFTAAAKNFAKLLASHPVSGEGLPAYGTNILINILNEAGGLPTRNFSEGRFADAEKVSGERLNEVTTKRGGVCTHGCMTSCVIRCSGLYVDEKGDYVTKWPEYETVWAWGPNCGINDLDLIAQIDHMCDDFGLDTIETGTAMAVAMEGGLLEFGDGPGALEILSQVGKLTPLGRILGCGTKAVGQMFGVSRVPVVKGQSMPAYDPRAVKGIGVTYATTPMGADHTAGYAVATNILKVGGDLDPLKPHGQSDLSRNLQIATAVIDTVGLCLFVAFPVLDYPEALGEVVTMLNARFGWQLTVEDVPAVGQKVLEMELDFNRRAGFNKYMDRLPDFFRREPLRPHSEVFDVSDDELDRTLDFSS